MSFKERLFGSDRVFVVGVAGDSGSGKTTFVEGIKRILGDDLVSSFSLDDYHSLDRKQRKEKGVTPLNPGANDLGRLVQDLGELRGGREIMKPVYDHSDGTFREPVPFKPTKVVIIEGLHPFFSEELRELSDFKIFVDPDRRVKRKWKIKRDVGQRGHKKEDVLEEMMVREPDYEKYVDVQKIYAEVLIQVQESRYTEPDVYSIRLMQRIVDVPLSEMNLSIDLSTLLQLSKKNFSLEFQRDDYYGHNVGILSMDGMIHRDVVESLEAKISAYTGREETHLFSKGGEYITSTNLAQLIICWRFIEKVDHILSS
ncbi:MAG: phosphoribulokinase [Candidatus Altiarchaeota archaeon]|nr:phosphoribulokinase [Candidatus Altiarchaeota archaeon]